MDIHLLLYIIGCVILIGFFTGMEIAFSSVNKISLELKKKQGSFSGKILGKFMENSSEFTGAGLVAVFVILVIYVILLMQLTRGWINHLPAPFNSLYSALVINIVIATTLLIIFGELLPRTVFRKKAESILSFFALPMLLVYKIFHPLLQIFVSISSFVLKYLFNVRIKDKDVFSRIDIEHFVKNVLYGTDTESRQVNTELFDNALNLLHKKVRHCMKPRKEIIGVEASTPIAEVKNKLIKTKLSKIIVYEQNLDNIIGYIHHLDFNKKPSSIQEILHTISTVPETMNVVNLINRFTKEKKSIAWVIDEFGGTAGIVTMEDLLEEIFGEIQDEYDDDEYVEKQISENEYIFSGRLELNYLNEKYGFNLKANEAETLSGFIISNQERIPKNKARIIIGLYEFDILLVSDTRIETVKLKLLKPL